VGHIDLAAPVVHCRFFRNNPRRIGALLGLTRAQVERVVYYPDHVVLDPGPTNWKGGHVLTDEQDRACVATNGEVVRVAINACSLSFLSPEIIGTSFSIRCLPSGVAAGIAKRKPERDEE
jgi:DNA-directed RNA polymerase beta' subunit